MRGRHQEARRRPANRDAWQPGGGSVVHLIKLGGSVITDKSRYRAANVPAISRLGKELAATQPLVVVHGAGSFGHILAKRHGLAAGKGDALAAARVHADVRDLQGLVVASLLDAGVPALALSTADLWPNVAMRTAQALAAGFTPVLPGDVVLGDEGWTIASGDVLMAHLAEALRPAQAIFATDVDGIYDQYPGGAVLPRIAATDKPFAGPSGKDDVTGGMAGKLERARAVAKHTEVLVLNGTVPGRVGDALAGRDVVCTRVLH